MIKKKLGKLIGKKKEDFDQLVKNKRITLRGAYLIPVLKTGDEMALTSIFLASLRLVKEYREQIFSTLRLGKSGKVYYFTEVCFPEVSKRVFDGMIIVVKSGKISDAVFFEMKHKRNKLDQEQIQDYITICKDLGVNNVATISNEFVADPSHSSLEHSIIMRIKTYIKREIYSRCSKHKLGLCS